MDILIVASNAHVHEAVNGMEEVAELIGMITRHTPSQLFSVLNGYNFLVITVLAHVAISFVWDDTVEELNGPREAAQCTMEPFASLRRDGALGLGIPLVAR
jgi:hypothetical protein